MKRRYLRKLKKLVLQTAYLGGKPLKRTQTHEAELPPQGTAADVDASFARTYCDKKAVLTIVSDDGDFETGKALDALTKTYGLSVTVAGTVTNIGSHEAWWKAALRENPLLELVSHSYNHACMGETNRIAKSRLRLRHEIAHSKQFFEKHFGKKQICFVCPENKMCAIGYEVLQDCGYVAVRRGTRGNNVLYPKAGREPGELYNLKSRGIMDHEGDVKTRREAVQTAIDNREWLIEMWHNVRKTDDGAYQTILLPDAEQHLTYLKERSEAGDLWIATLTDVVKYATELETAILATKQGDDALTIYAGVTTDDPVTYDHALTVCFRAPEGYEIAEGSAAWKKDDGWCVNVPPNTAVRIPLNKL